LHFSTSIPALHAQLIDNTQATSTANAGINKSLSDEVGAGRGDVMTPGSSIYIINRDPYRSIRRGRQLFQRKFTRAQGQGPNEGDGVGDLNTDIGIGAGLADSCALCHGRPRGSAGVGGNVVTRPDSRDSPHLFGLGLKEMLADEITTDLRSTRVLSIARSMGRKPYTHRSDGDAQYTLRTALLPENFPLRGSRIHLDSPGSALVFSSGYPFYA